MKDWEPQPWMREDATPTGVLVCVVYDLWNDRTPDLKGYTLAELMAGCTYVWPLLQVHAMAGTLTRELERMNEAWWYGHVAVNEMYLDERLPAETQLDALCEHEAQAHVMYQRYRALDPPAPTLEQLVEGARRWNAEKDHAA